MNPVLLEKQRTIAESYRAPMMVMHLRSYRTTVYYICPRCGVTMEREFMAHCDRCGQCLNWENYKKAATR